MEMAPFLFSWHSKPKYFNSSLNVKWCIKYGYFDIQSHGCRKPGLGLLFKLLRAPVILKHFVLQSFHAYFHVSATFISVNSPILQVARESWFWWARESKQLTWSGEEAKISPDSPVLTGSSGPLWPLPSSNLSFYKPLCTPFQKTLMVLRILLTTMLLSPVVYITTSRFEVKCESGWASHVVIKNAVTNTRDIRGTGFILGLERSHGEENGFPLQYSCLGKSMEKESGGAGATTYWMERVGDDLETKPPWLIHIVLSLKPTQHCKAIILQFEKKTNKKRTSSTKNAKTQIDLLLFFFWWKDSKFRDLSCKEASPGGLQIETLWEGPGEATWEGTHIGLKSYTCSLADS